MWDKPQNKSPAREKKKQEQPKNAQSAAFIQILSELAESEQQKLNPLPIHSTAKLDEHFRHHYALLIAALLGVQQKVSKTQSRLLKLFLDSMSLRGTQAALIKQANDIKKSTILEAAHLIRDAGYESEFMVDAMVFLRIDSPLTSETIDALSELASILNIDAIKIRLIAEDAAQVLGLGDKPSRRRMNSWPKSRVIF